MNKAVEKFIKLMEEENNRLERNIFILSRRNNALDKKDIDDLKDILKDSEILVNWLKNPVNEDCVGKVFVNFRDFSETLKRKPLKLNEIFKIVLYAITKNIEFGLLEINECDYYFNMDILKKEIIDFAVSKRFIYSPFEINLTAKEKEMCRELAIVSKKSIAYIQPVIEGHNILNKYLLSKLPDIEKEDIPIIMDGFAVCGFTANVLQSLELYLNNLVSKKKDSIVIPVKERHLNTLQLSNKELRTLNKELSYYYDLDHDKAIRELSLDEEFYVINIMQRLGYSKEVMTNILNKINELSNINPIVLYARIYDKYASYKEAEKIKDILEELEMYFQNMFMCDSEEYTINKMCFYDTFNKLIMTIPNDYEYEFSESLNLKR